MILWRIAGETRAYAADDMSGAGAAKHPGRWNDDGQPVVYAAPTIAIAVLETAAHIDTGGLPLNRYLVQIQVPAKIWKSRVILDRAKLPPAWDSIPAGRASIKVGADWLSSMTSLLLEVPSVIVPEEPAVLVNPSHPDAGKLKARTVRRFEYDSLFRS